MKRLLSFTVKIFMDCHDVNNDCKRDMLPTLVVDLSLIRIQTFEDNTDRN